MKEVRMLQPVIAALALSLNLMPVVHAQGDDSITGTHAVTFQPTQVGGNLIGCALMYRVVQFDHTYLGGAPIVAVGNIALNQSGGSLGLSFKMGVKNLAGDAPFVSPNFAYLQTKNASTAKVKQVGKEVEKGFRYTVYSFFDPTVQAVFDDIIATQKVTLAFNRKANGLDVLIPVDLDVIDATYPGGNKVTRVKSKETMNDFLGCFEKLIAQAESSLNKK
jgi:hypothetical protein